MRRLAKFLQNAIKNSDSAYKDMYTGYISLPSYGGYSDVLYDPTYWNGKTAYVIERPHKLSPDCPEVTVCIPAEDLINTNGKDDDLMKRLKDYLLAMQPNNSSYHASGSTSQAANIMEAVESGAKTMLIDEDISATNFMIRDAAMKELIVREPITPFTERARELYASAGVSTILVIGGSGEYLSVADTVIMMDSFIAYNSTQSAKSIAEKRGLVQDVPDKAEWFYKRMLKTAAFTTYPENSGTEILAVSDLGFIIFGEEKIDIRMLHNIVSSAQLTSMAYIIRAISLSCSSATDDADIDTEIDRIYEKIHSEGLDAVHTNFFINERWMELPRKCEVKAAINRMRNIEFRRV